MSDVSSSSPRDDFEDFEDFQDYLSIDARTRELVRLVSPVLLGRLDQIVKGFYDRMRQHVDAMARFPGGEAQLARQELALRGWLTDLLENAGNLEDGNAQVRIGHVHLTAGVNEELMIASMNWLRSDMADILRTADLPEGVDFGSCINALNQLLDYNLGLILTSYWRVLQERVMRADRLILIGQFTAAINHELRNPLGVIGTSAYLLRRALGDDIDTKASRHLEKIDRSLERANSIISGLLRLLRVEQPKRKPVDLKAFLAEMQETLFIPQAVECDFRVSREDNHTAAFDSVQLGQVIENLVRNSVDAMEGEGRLLVEIDNGPEAIAFFVRDSGPGIPLQIRHQIFDPLFSTKSFGTGLGLTLARAIVESHGGSFEIVEGLEGRGVGFWIRIPHYLAGLASPDEDEVQL